MAEARAGAGASLPATQSKGARRRSHKQAAKKLARAALLSAAGSFADVSPSVSALWVCSVIHSRGGYVWGDALGRLLAVDDPQHLQHIQATYGSLMRLLARFGGEVAPRYGTRSDRLRFWLVEEEGARGFVYERTLARDFIVKRARTSARDSEHPPAAASVQVGPPVAASPTAASPDVTTAAVPRAPDTAITPAAPAHEGPAHVVGAATAASAGGMSVLVHPELRPPPIDTSARSQSLRSREASTDHASVTAEASAAAIESLSEAALPTSPRVTARSSSRPSSAPAVSPMASAQATAHSHMDSSLVGGTFDSRNESSDEAEHLRNSSQAAYVARTSFLLAVAAGEVAGGDIPVVEYDNAGPVQVRIVNLLRGFSDAKIRDECRKYGRMLAVDIAMAATGAQHIVIVTYSAHLCAARAMAGLQVVCQKAGARSAQLMSVAYLDATAEPIRILDVVSPTSESSLSMSISRSVSSTSTAATASSPSMTPAAPISRGSGRGSRRNASKARHVRRQKLKETRRGAAPVVGSDSPRFATFANMYRAHGSEPAAVQHVAELHNTHDSAGRAPYTSTPMSPVRGHQGAVALLPLSPVQVGPVIAVPGAAALPATTAVQLPAHAAVAPAHSVHGGFYSPSYSYAGPAGAYILPPSGAYPTVMFLV